MFAAMFQVFVQMFGNGLGDTADFKWPVYVDSLETLCFLLVLADILG